MRYSHGYIEKKWQKKWNQNHLFRSDLDNFNRSKFYVLDMFPYPSGSGLHIGHIRGYLATDIIARMKRMQGFSVLHPLGFDSFGLPAEQYAIKTKKDPKTFTLQNINNFIEQLSALGFSYDFDFPLITSSPKYFQDTQWAFIELFKSGLAKRKRKEVNFCPGLNTVLANEEIVEVDGKMLSERDKLPVFRIKQEQWVIDLASFGDRLIEGMNSLNWPESIKKSQINWIGKRNGYSFELPILERKNKKVKFFISDFSTLNEAEFVVLAMNNESLDSCFDSKKIEELISLRKAFERRPFSAKRIIDKNPNFLATELSVLNPWNNKNLPIFLVDYLDLEFATGSSFGTPKRDKQDWFLARNLGLVDINFKKTELSDEEKNKLSNEILIAIKKNVDLKKTSFFLLKDWIFSRQRYWGEPFPIVYQNKKPVAISEKKLPLLLPEFSFKLWESESDDSPTPLSRSKEWVEKCFDPNTMPQWAGSCWYFLGYILRKGDGSFFRLNSKEAKKRINFWMPVDLYVGGSEHAVSHLLYSRFWNRFLSENLSLFNHPEPFSKLFNQGMILSSDGKKMSKSKGNVVNPNDFLSSHGADAIRLHEKFLGPFFDPVSWNEKTLFAMRKWLARVFTIFENKDFWTSKNMSQEQKFINSKLIADVTENYEKFFFNVAISKMMSFINYCYKSTSVPKIMGLNFLKLLHPICPHLTEELAEKWISEESLVLTEWPEFNKKDLATKNVELVVQINGKLKKTINAPVDLEKEEAIALARNLVADFLIKKNILKVIYVQNRIVNFVI